MQELPFVQQLEGPMQTAREKLQQRLSAALKAAIMQQQASARQLCLLSFAAISDVSGAEKVHLPIIYPLSEIQNPFGLVFSDWLLQ